jgi:uncharacterized membrane protein
MMNTTHAIGWKAKDFALQSIVGGAGTFDGIFLTGILAVLLASLYARPRAARV